MTSRVIETIEAHAEGEPGRVVLGAEAFVEGATMAERFDHCVAELDGLRRLLLREPRGGPSLCGVFLLPPVSAGADFGIVVLEQGGFTPMSGSNTMCAVTAALETGLITPRGPETELLIDTAVGTVRATAVMEGPKVTSVTVANVPSYAVDLDLPLHVAGWGKVDVDVAFGGQFFVQLDAASLGIDLVAANAKQLTRAAALVKLAAREQITVGHPTNPSINAISMVYFHNGDRAPARSANVLFSGGLDPAREETWTGTLDRSPCGTGTCARMAALHARGKLAVGEDFSVRSMIDSSFIGRLTGEVDFHGIPAVLPTVTGTAWVTGRATWQLDPTDPYREGFTVGDIWGS